MSCYHTTNIFIHSTLDGLLYCFQISGYEHSCSCFMIFLLGIFLGMELIGHRICAFSVSQSSSVNLTLPPAM